MLRPFSLAIVVAFVSLGWAATAKKAPARKSSGQSTSGKAASKSGSKSAARKGSTKKSSTRATTWRNRQLQPTPQRYKEIQEALAAKGFLQPEEATGVWGQASIDALKNFQRAQNIEANGKINSLSLIALGLGPKREAVGKPPAPLAGQ